MGKKFNMFAAGFCSSGAFALTLSGDYIMALLNLTLAAVNLSYGVKDD